MDFISLPSALEHIHQGFVKCATAVFLFFEGTGGERGTCSKYNHTLICFSWLKSNFEIEANNTELPKTVVFFLFVPRKQRLLCADDRRKLAFHLFPTKRGIIPSLFGCLTRPPDSFLTGVCRFYSHQEESFGIEDWEIKNKTAAELKNQMFSSELHLESFFSYSAGQQVNDVTILKAEKVLEHFKLITHIFRHSLEPYKLNARLQYQQKRL